jgi:hypothetical protein
LLTFLGLRDQYFRNLQAYRLRARALEDISQSPHTRQQADPGSTGHFPFSPDDIAYSRAASNNGNHVGNTHTKSKSANNTSIANAAPILPISTWASRTFSSARPHTRATPPLHAVSSSTQIPSAEFVKTTFSIADAKPLPLIPGEARYSQGSKSYGLPIGKQQSDLLFQEGKRESSASSPTYIYSPNSLWSLPTPATMYSPIEDRLVEANRISDPFSELVIPENSATHTSINSRLSESSVSGYGSLVTSQRSHGHFSQSTCSSAMSSVNIELYAQGQENQNSGPHEHSPVSPQANRRVSGNVDGWAALSEPPAYRQQSYEPIAPSDHQLNIGQIQEGKNRSDAINDWIPPLTSHLHKIKTTHEIVSTSEYSSPVGIPNDTRRTSESIGSWGPTFLTNCALSYGAGIESGLEVVMDIDHDNEKMVVSQEEMPHLVKPVPTASIKSTDCSITQDASFYRFGGFCDGAKYMLKGDAGFKVVKRPSVSCICF